MVILKDHWQAINYLNLSCDPQGNDWNSYHKARIFTLLNQPDTALQITQRFIAFSLKEKDPLNLIASYNQHGLIAKSLERYDEAILSFQEAILIVDSLGFEKNRYGYITGNLGACFYAKEDYKNAYSYLEIDVARSLKNNDIGSFLSAATMIAQIDLKRSNYSKVVDRLMELSQTYSADITSEQELLICELLMASYKELNDQSNYSIKLNEWIALNKSISENSIATNQALSAENSANSLRLVTRRMESEKELLNQKLINKEFEEEQTQLKNLLLVSGLIITILVLGFIFWRYRANQSKKALIKEAQLELAQMEQNNLKVKVEAESQNVQMLSHELQVKKNFSIKMIKRLEKLESITKPELNNIEFFIQNELEIKSNRAEIQNQMGELSSNFVGELKIYHPDLTELEVKLAGMVVMKMSNKEISISKNTTLESSKKAKNRLKKKLKLAPEEELTTYLSHFL